MLAQIDFIGSNCSANAAARKKLQTMMDDYCVGTMRTARKNYICRKMKGSGFDKSKRI
jgi:hypothetical protein